MLRRILRRIKREYGSCTNRASLVRLRDKEKNKRVFILGNGPSLNNTDVDALCSEVSIASNAIFLLFEKKKYRPTYYTIEDYLVAEDRAKEAFNYKEGWKIFPSDVQRFIQPDHRTIYVNFLRNYEGFPLFSDDFAKQVFWGGTVTFMNLQLAYYLGARKIYLLGFDHNYRKPDAADKVQGTVITSQSADVNHFDPRYFGSGYRWHDPKVERMEDGYRAAHAYCKTRGVEIYNATAGGHLEVFPRVSFESLV